MQSHFRCQSNHQLNVTKQSGGHPFFLLRLSIRGLFCPFADVSHSTGIPSAIPHRQSNSGCVILILYSDQKEYGHRRQKLFMEFRVWPETAIRLSPPQTFPLSYGRRAGCSGWKTRQRTSLAVQQQRFENDKQC